LRIPVTYDDIEVRRRRMTALSEREEPERSTEETEADIAGSEKDENSEVWKNRCICLKADFENYKRHSEAERDRLAELGKESVLSELFPIAEHLERAVAEAKKRGANNGVVEGLELVQKDMERIFEKYDMERIPTVGECFDPEVHEAVAVIEAHDICEGTIVEEVKPGFRRNGKLMFPAKVVVAK
jgi:molecular chaperone GrpE